MEQHPAPVQSWWRTAWLLEVTRQRQAINALKYAPRAERFRRWAGLAFRFLWPLGTAVLGAWVFRGLRFNSPYGNESAHFLLAMIGLFTALLLFVSAIKFAYQTFFSANDIPLLQGLPLPPRGIFVGKYLDNLAFSNQLVMIFALGPFVAYGLAFDWPLSRHLLAVAGLMFLPVYTTAIGLLVSIPVSRLVTRSRMRETLMLGSMAASVAAYALMRQAIRVEVTGAPEVETLLWDWLPVSWLVMWGIDLVPAESGALLAQYFYIGAALFLASAWLGDAAYQWGVSHLELEGQTGTSRAVPWLLRWPSGRPGPLRAVWFKDLLTFLRDPRQWYYLVFFAILFFMPVDPTGKLSGAKGIEKLLVDTISNAFILILMATMALQELTVLGVSRESNRRWLMQALPFQPGQILGGKFLVVLAGTVLLVVFGAICLMLIGQLAPADVPATVIGALLIAGVLNFTFLSLGAQWPDIEGYSQRQRVSPVLALTIALVDGIVIGILLFSATLLASYHIWAPAIPLLGQIPYSALLAGAVTLMVMTLLGLAAAGLWLGYGGCKRLLQEV